MVFPRGSNQKPKKGDAPPAETAAAVQVKGKLMPIVKKADTKVTMVELTAEVKGERAYMRLRQARTDKKLLGRRAKKAAEKAEEKPKAAEDAAAE